MVQGVRYYVYKVCDIEYNSNVHIRRAKVGHTIMIMMMMMMETFVGFLSVSGGSDGFFLLNKVIITVSIINLSSLRFFF